MFNDKSHLENLFIDCLNIVRTDIYKRRENTLSTGCGSKQSLTGHNTKDRNMYSNEDAINSRLQNIDMHELENSFPFEKFTASDKRKVVDLLFSNEDVKLFLYEILFPYRRVCLDPKVEEMRYKHQQKHSLENRAHEDEITHDWLELQEEIEKKASHLESVYKDNSRINDKDL